MFTIDKMIYQLGKVPYATVYNFQPWTSKNKNSKLKDSLQDPGKLIKKLMKSETVVKVPVYPPFEEKRHFRDNTFYALNGSLNKKYNTKYDIYLGQIAADLRRHQSGLIDIFLAFINLYPDYEIEIDWNRRFPYKKKIDNPYPRYIDKFRENNYVPDGVVKLTSRDMKEYYFIIEFERTKTAEQIRRDKFKVCNSLGKFETYGLSRYTKFLIIYTYELYNVYSRPIEYDQEEIKIQQQAVDHRLHNLIKTSQELISDTFRFMSFHNFYRLNETVWFNNKLEKVRLIY